LIKCLLEKLGFGPSFCRWIKIFYNQIYSAIKCNGHISKYFHITNSVRQGCPISALLFILTAEPLALNIKANKDIKGIQIPGTNIDSLIYQHADDTTLTLCDKESIKPVFHEFDKYGMASGSTVNKSKSEILCIGKSDIDETELINIAIKKCKNIIKVLGVYLGKNQNYCDEMNWREKVIKIKNICNLWKQRSLNIQGRAVVISSLLLSKLWYTLMVQSIPDWALHEIKTIVLQFLWMKKSYPVRYNTIIGDISSGGLYIPDIQTKSKGFRLKFMKRFLDVDDSSIWKNCLIHFLQSEFKMNIGTGYIYLHLPRIRLMKLSKIHQEMFVAWNEIKDNIEYKMSYMNILEQPLFYNPKITYKAESLYFKSFIEAGIVRLKDITYEVIPGFLRMSAIKEIVMDKCSDISEKTIETAYIIIKHSIPIEWFQMIEKNSVVKAQVQNPICIVSMNGECWPLALCRTNFLYRVLLSKILQPPISRIYWKELFPDFDISKYATVCHLKVKFPDMINLDFRILHNIIYTNKTLAKIGILDNEMCTYCNNCVEDMKHLFLNCKRVKQFISFLQYHTENMLRLMPNNYMNTLNWEELVLLGCCNTNNNFNFYFLNFFMSQARLCIFKTRGLFLKTGKHIDPIFYFKHCLERNIRYMLSFYTTCKKLENFEKYVLHLNCLVKQRNNSLEFFW